METINEVDLSPDKEHMKTLVSCINSLTKFGFTAQFKVQKDNKLKSLETEKTYGPEDVIIKNFYRFEGESDPADNSILYAIETTSGERGTLSDAFGVYGDANVAAFVKDVEAIRKREHHK
jgi:hypothetical protein